MLQEPHAFPPGVVEKLKTYVYRLIDPRNGETFYIGKGTGNRVFAHVNEQPIEGDEADNKLKRIREIHFAGLLVGHVIHRHGMDDATAFEVESALMDAYPGLTNEVGGVGGNEFGATNAVNFPGRAAATGRFGFNGREAAEEIQRLYVGKRIPDEYRKRGAANPVKYVKPTRSCDE